ncbi:response regulator [Endozoicomonas arenosclerae]|uniref:response regulator n=1 Tax=Endozoicomonas arenosclerae TaxID=1633495 RepID=UPI00078562B5|nr:response regulator [Endozoicomonas arenosclerae]
MNKLKILIVEDETGIAELHRMAIERLGSFEVSGIATNLEQAAQMVAVLKPDLLLLDVYLPDGTGVDLLKQLRNEGMQQDVILITAAREAATLQEALHGGVFDYILKPVIYSRLEQSLQRYLEFRQRLDSSNELQQAEVDKLLSSQQNRELKAEILPKGIDQITLQKLRSSLSSTSKNFSADEIGQQNGMSRTTARRYLEFLTTTGELRCDLDYGSVGRPQRLYRKV